MKKVNLVKRSRSHVKSHLINAKAIAQGVSQIHTPSSLRGNQAANRKPSSPTKRKIHVNLRVIAITGQGSKWITKAG